MSSLSKRSLLCLLVAVVLFTTLTTASPLQRNYIPRFLPWKRQDSNHDNGDDQGADDDGSDGANAGGVPQDVVPQITPTMSTPAYHTGTPYTGSGTQSWTWSPSPMSTPGWRSYTNSRPATSMSMPASGSYSLPPMTKSTSSSSWMHEPTPLATPPSNSSMTVPMHPPVGQGLQWCGKQRYSPTVYTCYGDALCPFIGGEPSKPCGKACYPPSKYECRGDKLQTLHKPGSPGSGSTAASNSGASSGSRSSSRTVSVPPLPTGSPSMSGSMMSKSMTPHPTGTSSHMMSSSSWSRSMTYSHPAAASASAKPNSKYKGRDEQQMGYPLPASEASKGDRPMTNPSGQKPGYGNGDYSGYSGGY